MNPSLTYPKFLQMIISILLQRTNTDSYWVEIKSSRRRLYRESRLTDSPSCDCWTLPQNTKKQLLFKSDALRPTVDISRRCLGYFHIHAGCIFPGNNTVWGNWRAKHTNVASPRGDFNLLGAVNIHSGVVLCEFSAVSAPPFLDMYKAEGKSAVSVQSMSPLYPSNRIPGEPD